MTIHIVLMGLLGITLIYGIRTLLRMRHRLLYPLIRMRQANGHTAPVWIRQTND